MDKVVGDILDELRRHEKISAGELDRIIRKRSAEAHDGRRVFAKKRILPYYLHARAEGGETWRSWNVGEDLDARFVQALQMKPRRTASGVATITVITKPWPCSNNCIYCPNDPDMPKSYLSDEPACQRALLNEFDPYRQVRNRLGTLEQMGHATDKVELIVLGGTWFDYPPAYRTWFISELFRALNDHGQPEAMRIGADSDDPTAPGSETAAPLHLLQAANEHAGHRCVGLVVETRPDTIAPETLTELRMLGCTKIQLGVQSIDDALLRANGRKETSATIADALALARLFGFKTHAHFMLNLVGATPESDKRDYRAFVTDRAFLPDEVKLYPCALVDGTGLMKRFRDGSWRPYTEDELVEVLCADLIATPPFTRVSRMIRDISSTDIVAGNKKTNLRQIVEQRLASAGANVHEIRYREIGTGDTSVDRLSLDEVAYETTWTTEHFLQWVTPSGKIAGFLRLSLPHGDAFGRFAGLPICADEAMIREVHVYGFATQIAKEGRSAQHRGLGRALVERACEIARVASFARMNVISAVGTREYYRKLGFRDNGLYQQRDLTREDG